ncbi:hypothetical protein [Rhodopirellula bahusiensis]|uniref:Uncharacterized protein n=1 Tax=Rhodopirellula bahusiensis TaxID=2014065 RepID=A0A2G1WAP5_9BACT|nr:hypothetical protein [Rhodopirellula bahusiensis]PHQ36107.1 hypothetical protein CEE69_05325 [Rhodopirellula bahusiensis]PHQ36116.1 hypothetical protein CEE69_05380 [Rhodopirellula bahusiensis]
MSHKVLKDHAHVFCQMFYGWRMQSDLETFAALPDGALTVDVLAGTCVHDSCGALETYIAGEMSAWFKHQLDERGIPLADIKSAMLFVDLVRVPPPKKKRGITFDWRGRGVIQTDSREYVSELAESHTWIPAS